VKRFALLALGSLSIAFIAGNAIGQNVFQKIGDGWRNGKWIPGAPNIRPQTGNVPFFVETRLTAIAR
jgi:hypothetical protein